MSNTGSITEWIVQLKAGESQASQKLWERYVARLVQLARKKLGRTSRRAADEEDVVLSAFDAFFRGVKNSRFPKLDDRNDIWQVLVMLIDRRAADHQRRELAAKRGGGQPKENGPSADCESATSHQPHLSQVIAGEPSPSFAAQCAEEFERLLASLANDTLRKIALAKMEGYTNEELAYEMDSSVRSIERKLRLIRRIWQQEAPS